MTIKNKSITNLPLSALVALIVTTLIFIAIPLLTKISTMKKTRVRTHNILISQRKPAPPPEPEKEKRLEEQKRRAEPERVQQRQRMPQPKLNVPASGLSAGMSGTIAISGLLKQDFEVSDSLFVSAFNLNEVDRRPSVRSSIRPRYPFEAQQKGIEGRVVIRCVVDANGMVKEPEIKYVEPKEVEGIFEEEALKCIKKWKFRPAMKGGKAVDCIVLQGITFSVTD